ncbi:MAG: zf-HC2 domain-containing protein [Gemmatimonadaceae bacterium]|nr:zf-HC2 domain-containing protein [Gemmatimonadaceae bacterium]
MTTHDVDALGAYLDDELDLPARERVAQHVAECESCRATFEALRRVRDRARVMHDRTVAVDHWPTIADALPSRAARSARRITIHWMSLAAAAVLLVAVSVGVTRRWSSAPAGAPPVVAVAPTTVRVQRVALTGTPPSAELAVASYDSASIAFRALLARATGRLRPETIRVLERNLAAIDRAIADTRRALRDDPQSAVILSPYLQDQMHRELTLLRETAALVAAADD